MRERLTLVMHAALWTAISTLAWATIPWWWALTLTILAADHVLSAWSLRRTTASTRRLKRELDRADEYLRGHGL